MAVGTSASGVRSGRPTVEDGSGRFASLLYVPTGLRERSAVRERMSRAGVSLALDLADAMRTLATREVTLCLVDLAGEHSAIAATRVIKAEYPATAVVGVVDPSNPVAMAEAMQAGVNEALPWPLEERDLASAAANALDRAAVPVANGEPSSTASPTVVAQSDAMRAVMAVATTIAGTLGGVCIAGEPGSGRQFLARVIHWLGGNGKNRPFVPVDCGGDSPRDVEQRLFGWVNDRPNGQELHEEAERLGPGGAFMAARGGTLYVTNLVDAPARVQAKLARLLRDREAWVGPARELVDVDVRAIAGVGGDLDGAVDDGRLRSDLYERFASAKVEVPPLRERRDDIPVLALHFLRDACQRRSREPKMFSRSSLVLMAALPWQGNVAELRGLVDALVGSVHRSVIQLDDVLEHASLDGMSARLQVGLTLRDAKAKFERECISAVLRQHHGRVGEAAKALGIQRTNLYRKVRQLNVARSLLSARR